MSKEKHIMRWEGEGGTIMNLENAVMLSESHQDAFIQMRFMAGDELGERIIEVLGDPQVALIWWSIGTPGYFNGKTPEDIYYEGKKEEINNVLNAIEYSVYL